MVIRTPTTGRLAMAYTPDPDNRTPPMVIVIVAAIAIAGAVSLWAVTSLVFTIPG